MVAVLTNKQKNEKRKVYKQERAQTSVKAAKHNIQHCPYIAIVKIPSIRLT